MLKHLKNPFFVVFLSIIFWVQFWFALTGPTEDTIILDNLDNKINNWPNTNLDSNSISNNNAQELVKPSQTTIFMNNIDKTSPNWNTNEVYYSDKSIEFDIQLAIRKLKKLDWWVDELTKQILDLDKSYKVTDKKY